jgi:SAM-dependent methyltransferase
VSDYGPSTYGDRIAGVYDAYVEPLVAATTSDAVEFLARLAGSGRALELGIGTGRIALPLAERGMRVHGIDASQPMLDRLRAKPGGAEITLSVGDFGGVDVSGEFDLIYVVFNTFFGLLDQEQQVNCFANVATHLSARGAFVIEAFVPDPALYDRGQRVSTAFVDAHRVDLSASRIDLATQRITSQHILIGAEGVTLLPVQLRYAWPSELDLMARMAGLRLRERFGGWRSERFSATSASHVSVYERKTGSGPPAPPSGGPYPIRD